jgi:hypothetical protein
MIRGVTTGTFEHLQLGEGAFLKTKYEGTLNDDMILSATRGGATISVVPVYRTRVIDGVPANTKEAKAVDSVSVNASFVALEITPELLKRALGSADLSGNKLTLRHKVETTDFEDLYWIGEVSDGRKVQITFKNAFNENGLSLKTAQNNEGELSMNFSGNYSVANLDTPPVEIEFINATA